MKALQDASSENDSDRSDSNSSSETSSDSDFDAVMKIDTSEEPKGKKTASKAKAKAKNKARQSEKATEKVEKPSAKEKDAQKEAARFTSAITTQQKTLDLLKELNFGLIWRSTVRAAEVERRLVKGGSAREELSRILLNPRLDDDQQSQAKALDEALEETVSTVTSIKEVCRIVRSSTPEALEEDILKSGSLLASMSKCSAEMLDDMVTLSDILHVIGKKLVEVPWLNYGIDVHRIQVVVDAPEFGLVRLLCAQVPTTSFFVFFQILGHNINSDELSLGSVYRMYTGDDKMDLMSKLIGVQSKAVSELFFEKLRGNASVEMAKSRLPSWLKVDNFDVETAWLLRLNCEDEAEVCSLKIVLPKRRINPVTPCQASNKPGRADQSQ